MVKNDNKQINEFTDERAHVNKRFKQIKMHRGLQQQTTINCDVM